MKIKNILITMILTIIATLSLSSCEVNNEEIKLIAPTGTPTLFIGMRKEIGVGSYPELKQIVINEGGKEKANHG